MEIHLSDGPVNTVVLVAGGNDLPSYRRALPDDIITIAHNLINGGLTARNKYGVLNVVISSVLPRSSIWFQGNRRHLNNLLRELCVEHNFIFIENDNIILRHHLHHDGVHLNAMGSKLLSANLLAVLDR